MNYSKSNSFHMSDSTFNCPLNNGLRELDKLTTLEVQYLSFLILDDDYKNLCLALFLE